MNGWIKLHRQIEEDKFYFSERFTKAQAWIDLLLLAGHTKRTIWIRGIEINLKPGELAYSQLTLAGRWQWNFKTVKKFLNELEKCEKVETRFSNATTVISIKNWDKWQGVETKTERKTERKAETNKNDKNDKNKITDIVKNLVGETDGSEYGIVAKFSKLLGEKKLLQIIGSCVTRGVRFDNSRALAAYLQACANGIPTSVSELPWL
jgi:DNA-binding transcriptional regulator YhcF (GntR family)